MKLNIEIAQHERMASSGSSLLRSIQNNNLPVLDLIVRESIQNSLDAAQPDAPFVGVDFTIGSFRPELLNAYFESIGPTLTARYKGKDCKFLSIKDYNTVGLTGKMHFSEVIDQDFGNLQKLVYEVSKPQTGAGAGGSWGLGKTVYFRAGLGLVIYYSRIIDENGKYASRLAATLVEDENKTDALIQYPASTKIKRGIAWWGKRYGGITSKSTCPITDQSSINNILQMLGVSPYSGTMTGTTIIIPYIDEKELLKGIAPADDITGITRPNYHWLSNAAEYLRMSVQRWYTPRLSSKYERGPYLKAYVNGESVTSGLAPYYKILLQLYENTTKENQFAVSSQTIDNIEYFCQKVSTRNILTKNGTVGWLSYAKVTEAALKMIAPDNEPNPYAFIGKYDIDRSNNPPILAYIRKPGMIVSYETTGAWLDGVVPTTGDEYIVALFVLNSDNEVKDYPAKSLEEYIRKSERSDHTSWCDWSFTDRQSYIVSRIKNNSSKLLRQTFAQLGAGPTTLTHSGLEKALADLLLPPDGFGHRSNSSGQGGSHGGQETSHSGKSPVFKVISTRYHGNSIALDFDFKTGKGQKDILVELRVVSESGSIPANKWEKQSTIGTRFPLRIVNFEMNGKSGSVSLGCLKNGNQDSQAVYATFENSSTFDVPYGLTISSQSEENLSFTGTLTFERDSSDISGAVSVTQKGGAK